MDTSNNRTTENSLRVIKTARTERAINDAVNDGYFPLIKKVQRHQAIKSKFCVVQDKLTGHIRVIGDYRQGTDLSEEVVIDWSIYYPHHFPSPFAAYLIPPDLSKGERVFIEDLIEDMVGVSWGQGDTYRLENAEAIWNGHDFEICVDPQADKLSIIG